MKLLTIAFCATVALPAAAEAMPSPASAFCQTMEGRTVIAKLPDGGEIGLCYLADKRIVEEWTLFRMFDGRKPLPGHNPFR